MSEEIKNKAVELTDEEIGQISGGAVTIVNDVGGFRNVYSCSHPQIKAMTFGREEAQYNFAGHFRSTVCQLYLAKDTSARTCCENCRYGNLDSYSMSSLTSEQKNNPKGFVKDGFQYLYIQG